MRKSETARERRRKLVGVWSCLRRHTSDKLKIIPSCLCLIHTGAITTWQSKRTLKKKKEEESYTWNAKWKWSPAGSKTQWVERCRKAAHGLKSLQQQDSGFFGMKCWGAEGSRGRSLPRSPSAVGEGALVLQGRRMLSDSLQVLRYLFICRIPPPFSLSSNKHSCFFHPTFFSPLQASFLQNIFALTELLT